MTIRTFALLLLAGALPQAVLRPVTAQCCLGAQDQRAESHDGRFVVEAESLTGTGHGAHGPYRFRFRTLRARSDGATELLGQFERAWDTTEHFGMSVLVSPTGNGFALSTTLEDAIRFFAPDGTELRVLESPHGQALAPREPTGHPLLVRLRSAALDAPSRRTLLWLPLCHVASPEQQHISRKPPHWTTVEPPYRWPHVGEDERQWLLRMLVWTPALGDHQQSEVTAAVASGDTARLVELGLSALPALRKALRAQPPPEHGAALRDALGAIRARLCGHDEPWRDLDLLAALLAHPDAELAACARGRLRAVLPADADLDDDRVAAWLAAHRDRLQWDARRRRYALR